MRGVLSAVRIACLRHANGSCRMVACCNLAGFGHTGRPGHEHGACRDGTAEEPEAGAGHAVAADRTGRGDLPVEEGQHAHPGVGTGGPYQQASATRSLLVECPHLRKYLFHDKPIERDAEEYDRARTIAEMLINYPEHLVIQQGSIRAHDLEAWQHFVSDMFTHSPLMRQVIEDNRGSYSRDLMRLYETRVH